MSPIATSPSTTVLETSRGGGHPTNGGHGGFSFGASGSGAPGRPGKRTLPHISDVTSVTVDLDPYTPIDKVLGSAESLLRQAESSRSFGRPDLALSDYIRASIIVVDLIKRNKGWASLQSDNKVQLDRYRHIVRQVDSLHEAYEKVKADIKADNARTGVQPVSRTRDSRDARATANGHGVDNAMHANERGQAGAGPRVDSSAGGGATTTTAKTKPAIHPKPQALHGNAIRSSASNGVAGAPKAAEDLAQRFAKLRQASAPRVQDPRIRTQPIVPPSSGDGPGHAAAPSSFPPSSFPPDTAAIARGVLPELPKVPDAIYSPARGSVSSTTGELPSSTPRGMYSRPGSVAPVPSSSHAAKSPAGEDYFGSYASATPTSSTTPVHRRSINVPPGDTLTVAELVELMRQGAKDLSILLIDIRSRAEFDDGHIMSQATICVESEVLMRENISANDIADSMVLAPTSEQLNFERRHSFDVIVFYDQDSTHISPYPNTPQQRAISGLYNALRHYDFAGEASPAKSPKLLQGGLDAWTSMMGHVSLQTSSTAMGNQPRPAPSPAAAAYRLRPARRYQTRPIQDAEEARRWEETLNDVETFSPVRTTEDFLRRFPSVSAMQESMAAPTSRPPPPSQQAELVHAGRDGAAAAVQHDLLSWPTPPQRPAPTVPRPSYSGLAEVDDRDELVRKLKGTSKGVAPRRKPVGLVNPGNWCYGNSSLQAMFGTPGFSEELSSGQWQELYRVPMSKDEKIQHPQLLVKMLANLFHWMNSGKFERMEAQTLMRYIHHIHGKNADGTRKAERDTFGSSFQHDAQEYLFFIIDQLHDETNRLRDRVGLVEFHNDDNKTMIYNAVRFWKAYCRKNDSMVDRYWRGVLASGGECERCRIGSFAFQVTDITILPLTGPKLELRSLLAQYTLLEGTDNYNCTLCHQPKKRGTRFLRLPDRFAVCFQRFQNTEWGTGPEKDLRRVEFPLTDLDLGPYCVPLDTRLIQDDPEGVRMIEEDRHFRGPFIYDCYAVVCHVGSSISSGHYISYVRDHASEDPTDWYRFNDDVVTRVKVGASKRDELERMYRSGNQQAYLVFYKRRGT